MSDSSGGNPEDERILLVKSISSLTETEETLLSRARDLLKESLSVFVEEKIGLLFRIVSTYKDVLQRHGLKTKAELNRYIQKYYRHPEVREAADEWQDLEREWDDFLGDIDNELDMEQDVLLNPGEEGPVDVSVVDARTGKATTLQSYLPSSSLTLVLLRHFA